VQTLDAVLVSATTGKSAYITVVMFWLLLLFFVLTHHSGRSQPVARGQYVALLVLRCLQTFEMRKRLYPFP
jgi:hypothetical protein